MNKFVQGTAERLVWWLGIACALVVGNSPALGQDPPVLPEATIAESMNEIQARWEYFATLSIPAVKNEGATTTVPAAPIGLATQQNTGAALVGAILEPGVFSHARADLADLRLYDLTGQTIPYALRYLRPQPVREAVPATEFNRAEPKDGPHELTLELQGEGIQHNETRIVTTGQEFRRAVDVEGSEDGKEWRRLVVANLLRFSHGEPQAGMDPVTMPSSASTSDNSPPRYQKIDVDSVTYPDTRFRFVRVRVSPDPNHGDANGEQDDFSILNVNVLRHLEVPGERLTMPGTVNAREPFRTYGSPGSAWIIDLGGENVPCDRIEVDVEDAEFARDILVEAEFPTAPLGQDRFSPVALVGDSLWQRKPGDPKKPMVAEFVEVQTRRLRLQVTDHRNPPLTIRSVAFGAPARQVVFTRPIDDTGELRLYFGNPQADLPNYDFARNLPPKLEPPPVRASLGNVERNPNFVPPPQPFTERFPWLIYVVLSSVTAVLAIVIVSLSRSAIAIHDANLDAPTN